MASSYSRPWVSSSSADMALLGLLQGSSGNSLPQGSPGLWIEGTSRLGVSWGSLKVGRSSGLVGTLSPLLCLATPSFFSLRASVGGTASTSVVRVASASWGWSLAGYGAAASSWAVWAVSSPAGVQEKEPGQENRTLSMKRLSKSSRPDSPFLIAAFFFLVVAVWGETLIPRYSGRVIDISGGDFDPDAFASAIFFMCSFSVGSSFSAGCRGGSFLFTMSRINSRIREQLFSSLLRQDLGFFQETKTGESNSRSSSDTSSMSRWLPFNANISSRSSVKVVGLYFFMLQVSPRLTFLSSSDSPLTIAAEKVYNPRHQAVLKEIQDAVAKAGQVVREAVGGSQTVRSFGAEEQEVSRYKEASERCRQSWWRRDSEKDVYLVIRRVMALGMQVSISNCGVQQISAGEVTRGGSLSFSSYQEEVGQYVRNSVYMYGDMSSNVGAAEKVFSYSDRRPNSPQPGISAPPWSEGRVEFQDVSFSYPRRPEKPVLQGSTFTSHPGTVTALVGPNGSGKSTVAASSQNSYQPTGGQLSSDGEPSTEYDHHYSHRQVVSVGQEPVSFSGSVKDNIAYGSRDCEDAQVMAAAQAACADDFIREMTNGINTEIGEKGGQLAVGQKQRSAIARALVRNPRVLISDEATSASDAQCEQALQNWRSQGDRTMSVIAHRSHTVQNADQVSVLKQGRSVEHDQLRDGQDVYAHLVQQRSEA